MSGRLPAKKCTAKVGGRKRVKRVVFTIDGQALNTERESPYTCGTWQDGAQVLDTRRLSNGRHALRARVVDGLGRSARHQVTFVVRNARSGQNKQPSGNDQATTPPPPSLPGVGSTLFADGFENGFDGWQHFQAASADRISLVNSPVRSGARAARFEVRSGDSWNGESDARAELAYTENLASEGQEQVYSWSTMFAPDYPSSKHWQDFLQWKNEGTGSPPLQMKVEGEQIHLQAGSQLGWKKVWSAPLIRGRWLDFSVRVHWSEDPSRGWVELSYDGQQALGRTYFANLYPGLRNYLKIGLYRSALVQGTGVVTHDNVSISTP